MVNEIFSKIFRRNGTSGGHHNGTPPPTHNGDTLANAMPPIGPVHIQPLPVSSYSFLDVSDEKTFLLLTGIKEDEFVALALSSKAGLTAGEPHNNTTLFESFELVKKLRLLEADLKEKQKKVEQTYTLSQYQTILQNIRGQWNEKFAGIPSENGHANGNGHSNGNDKVENDHHRYYDWLQKKSALNLKNLQDFYFGPSQDNNIKDERKTLPYGNQADIETVYNNRMEIKQKLVKELEDDIPEYNSKKARLIYTEYNKAFTMFFWSLFTLLSFFFFTSFFIWYLISPYSWEYLPVAILFGGLLIFVPSSGFKNLFKLQEANTDYPAYKPSMPRKKDGWLIAFDILLPVAISVIILVINWNSISGYTLPFLTIAGVFLLLLFTRAAVCLLLPGIPDKYKEALEKLYQKRAFDKYSKEHVKNLQAGQFNYKLIDEIKEHEQFFLQSEAAFRQKYQEILYKDKDLNRQLFTTQLQEYYKDNEENFNAYYKLSQSSPYLQDINDLGTVRRLLARLDYLFKLAMGS